MGPLSKLRLQLQRGFSLATIIGTLAVGAAIYAKEPEPITFDVYPAQTAYDETFTAGLEYAIPKGSKLNLNHKKLSFGPLVWDIEEGDISLGGENLGLDNFDPVLGAASSQLTSAFEQLGPVIPDEWTPVTAALFLDSPEFTNFQQTMEREFTRFQQQSLFDRLGIAADGLQPHITRTPDGERISLDALIAAETRLVLNSRNDTFRSRLVIGSFGNCTARLGAGFSARFREETYQELYDRLFPDTPSPIPIPEGSLIDVVKLSADAGYTTRAKVFLNASYLIENMEEGRGALLDFQAHSGYEQQRQYLAHFALSLAQLHAGTFIFSHHEKRKEEAGRFRAALFGRETLGPFTLTLLSGISGARTRTELDVNDSGERSDASFDQALGDLRMRLMSFDKDLEHVHTTLTGGALLGLAAEYNGAVPAGVFVREEPAVSARGLYLLPSFSLGKVSARGLVLRNEQKLPLMRSVGNTQVELTLGTGLPEKLYDPGELLFSTSPFGTAPHFEGIAPHSSFVRLFTQDNDYYHRFLEHRTHVGLQVGRRFNHLLLAMGMVKNDNTSEYSALFSGKRLGLFLGYTTGSHELEETTGARVGLHYSW